MAGLEVILKNVGGHIEAYDRQGKFLFSADTEQEAMRELDGWTEVRAALKNRRKTIRSCGGLAVIQRSDCSAFADHRAFAGRRNS